MQPPLPTPIYHITHWRNLEGILASGGLDCCTTLHQHQATYLDLANNNVQDKRARTQVPCGPCGCLHDYVPFYFAPRSPMPYVINCGGERYPERQTPVVHLVSTAQSVYEANCPLVFTNGHAIMALSDFFTELADLEQIDWVVMRGRYWNDTQDQPGRKCRRQAEFLVHRHFPWSLVTEVAVINRDIGAQVQALLVNVQHRPAVTVRPTWYY